MAAQVWVLTVLSMDCRMMMCCEPSAVSAMRKGPSPLSLGGGCVGRRTGSRSAIAVPA